MVFRIFWDPYHVEELLIIGIGFIAYITIFGYGLDLWRFRNPQAPQWKIWLAACLGSLLGFSLMMAACIVLTFR
jgi:hypothetical protein